MKRAIENKKIAVKFYNPRDFSEDKHARVDRRPYGGGPGMVIQAEPVIKAIEKAYSDVLKNTRIRKLHPTPHTPHPVVIWLTPSGKQFDTKVAKAYAKKYTDIIFVCGRYEGIDARVKKVFSARSGSAFCGKVEEVSVGPFVLTGGELPAMIIMDCVSRQIEGVLGNLDSIEEKRVSSSEVYTRPEVFVHKGRKYRAPKVLLSGHHGEIDEWREKMG